MNDNKDSRERDSSTNDCRSQNKDLIAAHCKLLHEKSAKFADQGKLILASYGQNPETGESLQPIVSHYNNGDCARMAADCARLSQEKHRNVYIPLTIMRQDLPPGKKGGEEDIVAVLGLVADFDDARASDWASRCPAKPTYTLATSSGRFQCFFIFKEPIAPEVAKPLAKALKQHCSCDHGTADISHVWRVAGTLNWPNKKKVKEGRSPEPQLVRVAEDNGDLFHSVEELTAAMKTSPNSESGGPNASSAGPEKDSGQQSRNDPTDLLEYIENLNIKAQTKRLILDGAETGSRSEAQFTVLCALIGANVPDDLVIQIFETFPIGQKYREKGKGRQGWLQKDIARAKEYIRKSRSGDLAIEEIDRLHREGKLTPDAWKRIVHSYRLDENARDRVIDHLVTLGMGGKRPLKNEWREWQQQAQSESEQAQAEDLINKVAGERTIVGWNPAELNRVVREVFTALASKPEDGEVLSFGKPLLYVTDCKLPGSTNISGDSDNSPSIPGLQPHNHNTLLLRIDKSVVFTQPARRGPRLIHPPVELPGFLLNSISHPFPVVRGLVTHPLILPDGKYVESEGYNSDTQLYLSFGGTKFPPLIEGCASRLKAEIYCAFPIYDCFLAGFEFASGLDQAVAIAALLTALNRKQMDTAPGYNLTASMQGSGKTTLARKIHIVDCGRDLPVMTFSDDSVEIRKAITAALIESPPMLVFDNVPDGYEIRSPEIARLLTAPVHKDRLLGVSQQVELPTNVTVCFTGNNIVVNADLARRILPCRLQPKCEDPERRSFENPDVYRDTLLKRPMIMQAALSLVKAYLDAVRNGDDDAAQVQQSTSSGFPQWDRLVRFPILWATGFDVRDAIDHSKATSKDLIAKRAAIDALSILFPNQVVFSAADVFKHISSGSDPAATTATAVQKLKDAFAQFSEKAARSTKSTGWVLSKLVGFRTGQRVLVSKVEHNANIYRIDEIA